MAIIQTVSATDTPNEGRQTWNTNIDNINTELGVNTTKLNAVSGAIVGASNTQTLTNKTISSSRRAGSASSGNILNLSRLDLDNGSLFTVRAYDSSGVATSGIISDIDISQNTPYELKVKGTNGVSITVENTKLVAQLANPLILNNSGQKFGLGTSSVSEPYIAEFGGKLRTNGVFIGTGSIGSEDFHIKSSANASAIIESGGTTATLEFKKASQGLKLISDFSASSKLSINDEDSELLSISDSGFNLNVPLKLKDVTISGSLSVSGIYTGTIQPKSLIKTDPTKILMAGLASSPTTSGIMEYVSVTGDINADATTLGKFNITDNAVQAKHLQKMQEGFIFVGTGLSTSVSSSYLYGDVSIRLISGIVNAEINNNVILDKHISASTKISISKINLSVDPNTLILSNEGKISLRQDISALPPVGTILPYAGTIAALPTEVTEIEDGGWLLCNGKVLNPNDERNFDKLISLLGSNYGAANGTLPDLCGMFLRGLDKAHVRDTGDRVKLGTSTSHVEVGGVQTSSVGAHTHPYKDIYYSDGGGSYDLGTNAKGENEGDNSDNAGLEVNRTTSANTGTETRPINVAVNYIIKY